MDSWPFSAAACNGVAPLLKIAFHVGTPRYKASGEVEIAPNGRQVELLGFAHTH